ncbi:CpsD/CapB family tyrosine-protein kinase [Massilimicrobiota timonensis]|uniref:non-specific protein-tyrosine kinase n=1 Tax=Massilimicrobiota timonensis TaxID=1776392 RepID=A0ABT7UKP1_9FIRM|nr:CpsD/CapB family tyrosine-protein kinase [Massilimicrobiota timonensis]MDM8196711.1 CpsD/CapB family tyrosine-protein kinase [Massilimicrobiota timonensis]
MAQKKQRTKKTLSILDKNRKHNQFDYTEIFRHIRTNIEFSTVDKQIKSISITSTHPGEAKTTTSINLAYIFATKYNKVLLIDCDLRKTMLHRYMRISNQQGLTDALLEFGKTHRFNSEYIQTMSHPSFLGQLSILTGGVHVPNPSELLGSEVFKEYMDTLKKNFDFIIVDCAPVGTISDAIPVGNAVDGTIFVVSAKDTNRKDAANCVNLLQRSNVNVLGSVLTKADSGSGSYSYYYY